VSPRSFALGDTSDENDEGPPIALSSRIPELRRCLASRALRLKRYRSVQRDHERLPGKQQRIVRLARDTRFVRTVVKRHHRAVGIHQFRKHGSVSGKSESNAANPTLRQPIRQIRTIPWSTSCQSLPALKLGPRRLEGSNGRAYAQTAPLKPDLGPILDSSANFDGDAPARVSRVTFPFALTEIPSRFQSRPRAPAPRRAEIATEPAHVRCSCAGRPWPGSHGCASHCRRHR
jgi:hypothetical protein